jgi:hypothetical protein
MNVGKENNFIILNNEKYALDGMKNMLSDQFIKIKNYYINN